MWKWCLTPTSKPALQAPVPEAGPASAVAGFFLGWKPLPSWFKIADMWEIARLFGKIGRFLENSFGPKPPVLPPAESERRKRLFPGHSLYQFQLSPFAIRARRCVWKLGLSIPMLDVLEDSSAWQELVSQGGKDQVPCLKIERSGLPVQWMYESSEIIRYLETGVQAGK